MRREGGIDFPMSGGEHPPRMALTSSAPLEPGSQLPAFSLPEVVSGRTVTETSHGADKPLVVVFLCRHCPYVVHVLPALSELALEYAAKGVAFLGISSNDAGSYPDDAPEKLAEMATTRKLPFPIVHDACQDTARAFHAACTPEFFVFGSNRRLYYHGRMDGSTPGNGVPCTGGDLRAALDSLLDARPAPSPQHPSMGCNIKWK